MTGAVSAAQAAAAYRSALGVADGASAAPTEAGGGFGAALRRAVEEAVDLGRSADTASTQALLGQGSVTDVVLAVAQAELALQTAVTVRDRVVAAYQDVMRMPI
jgi:flagellar hook-basal body complex protein FliE